MAHRRWSEYGGAARNCIGGARGAADAGGWWEAAFPTGRPVERGQAGPHGAQRCGSYPPANAARCGPRGKVAILTMVRRREVVDRDVPDPTWEQAMRPSTGRAKGEVAVAMMAGRERVEARAVPDPTWEKAMWPSTARARGRLPSPPPLGRERVEISSAARWGRGGPPPSSGRARGRLRQRCGGRWVSPPAAELERGRLRQQQGGGGVVDEEGPV